ncbi:hypothetical protein IAG44_19280 [Streptomyces roseirectus]|uniref:Uncharacterized protein n=1 Tax=Streptomyces roseirectus TaxID=2768066 RepID=A0A7H0IEZ9_9ACTN|nr:hypothetical protein [Streptomyces roseirectus]QNP71365.1 hypothetical protein IAG44_19280 [Streptomyces roseirectus]
MIRQITHTTTRTGAADTALALTVVAALHEPARHEPARPGRAPEVALLSTTAARRALRARRRAAA